MNCFCDQLPSGTSLYAVKPPVLLVPTGILQPLNRWLNLQAAVNCLLAGVCVNEEVTVGLISVY